MRGNQYQVAVSILFVTYCVSNNGRPLEQSETDNIAAV